MGLETIAFAAFSFMSAQSQMRQAKSDANAVAQQGTLEAKNKARETVYKAAQMRQSFLSSGLTLEGTPMSVINETINTGKEDINQIIANANARSKNTMAAGRTNALNTLGKAFAQSSFDLDMGFGAGLPESTGGIPVGQAVTIPSAFGQGTPAPSGWDWQGTGGLY